MEATTLSSSAVLTRVIDRLGDSTKDGQTMAVIGMIVSGSLVLLYGARRLTNGA